MDRIGEAECQVIAESGNADHADDESGGNGEHDGRDLRDDLL